MSTKPEEQDSARKAPRTKATTDQPQEEFIAPDSARAEHDIDHGKEVEQARKDPARGEQSS